MYFLEEAIKEWVFFFELLPDTQKHSKVRVNLLHLLREIISELDDLEVHQQFIVDILTEAITQYARERYTTANAEPFKALVDTLKSLGKFGKDTIRELYKNRELTQLLQAVRA